MEKDNSNNNSNSDKNQTMFMIGISLIVIGIAIFFVGYSQPRIYANSTEEVVEYESQSVSYGDNKVVEDTVPVHTDISNEQLDYPININTASYDELTSIKGIGPSKANLIINYRNEIGEFESLNDLKNIKGFGNETIQMLSQYLTV